MHELHVSIDDASIYRQSVTFGKVLFDSKSRAPILPMISEFELTVIISCSHSKQMLIMFISSTVALISIDSLFFFTLRYIK